MPAPESVTGKYQRFIMLLPTSLKPNKDHWGFYQVGNYKTYRKLEAIEKSAETSIPMKWNFNNDVFDKFDWTQDPPGSLEFWYAQRAQQLRDTYDHIVLLMSGGADSTNILQTFVKNNIYIDEIASFIVLKDTPNGKRSDHNEEIFYTALPIAKNLLENNPLYATTKFTMVDAGLYEMQRLKEFNNFDYWYEASNFFYSPLNQVFGNLRDLHPEWKTLAEKKSVCLLWGYDKPKVVNHNNQFFIEFSESGMSSLVTPDSQAKNLPGEHDEMFYWSRDMPQLVAKQSHVILNYLKQINPTEIDRFYVKAWDYKNPMPPKNQWPTNGFSLKFVKDEVGYELTEHGLHRLIYKHWNPYNIVAPKAPSLFFGAKDDWLWQSNVEGAVPKWYKMGAVWLKQRITKIMPSAWTELPSTQNVNRRFPGSVTQCKNRYPLEKPKIN